MKYCKIKMMVLTCLLLLCGLTLSAQEGIANIVYVEFTTLNCGSSFEELNEFLNDYNQCQLQMMFWYGYIWHTPCCTSAYLIFHAAMIETDALVDQLLADERVVTVQPSDEWIPRPRQLALKLVDDNDESELIDSYAEYGLRGSNLPAYFHESGLRCFTFDDTTIYSGDFINLLRGDARVDIARLQLGWMDGQFLVHFGAGNLEDVFNDYNFISFVSISGITWKATFDFQLYDEFLVLEQLQNDARIFNAVLNRTMGPDGITLCDVQQPVTTSNDDIVELVNISSLVSVYPNPFNPETTIIYHIGQIEHVKLQVYNVKGQIVRTLVDGTHNRGSHSIVWNGKDNNNRSTSSGVYFLRLETNSTSETRRILLMK